MGSRTLAIVPSKAPSWMSVAFVIDDTPGDVIRAVVALDGRIGLSYWDPQGGNPRERLASREEDWCPIATADVNAFSPVVRALVAHVSALQPDEIRAMAYALVNRACVEETERLAGYREFVDLQVEAVDAMERRLAVLAMPDRAEREVALQMCDGWKRRSQELVVVAAEVTALRTRA